MAKLNKNTAKVGEYSLTFSMATLCFADQELKKKDKKPVLDMFSTIAPALMGGDLSELNLDGIDFESFAIAIWCFLRPDHDLEFEDCLDGPLSQGTPKDWMLAIFNLVNENSEKAKPAKAGNVKAA